MGVEQDRALGKAVCVTREGLCNCAGAKAAGCDGVEPQIFAYDECTESLGKEGWGLNPV